MPEVLAKKYTITNPETQASDIDEMFDDLYKQLIDTNVTGSGDVIGTFFRVGTGFRPGFSTLVLPNTAVKGDILYASATNVMSMLADVAVGSALISGGVGAIPAWGKIGLTTHVSGTLPVGNGGTGATTFTAGSIPFSDGSILTEDNTHLFWDDANNRLGMGTATPAFAIDLRHTGTRSQIHFSTGADNGGYLTALDSDTAVITSGAAWSAAWFANVAACAGIFLDAGSVQFTADSGLSFPGVSFTPTIRGQIWPSGGVSFFGTMVDPGADIYRISGALAIGGANGQAGTLKSLTELTTIAAAATTDTTIQFPANCHPIGVSVRVTVVIPTAATFDVGDAGTPTLFNAALSTAANTTGKNAPSAYTRYTAATSVRITPNLVPAANTGRVRVTLYYIDFTAPTS